MLCYVCITSWIFKKTLRHNLLHQPRRAALHTTRVDVLFLFRSTAACVLALRGKTVSSAVYACDQVLDATSGGTHKASVLWTAQGVTCIRSPFLGGWDRVCVSPCAATDGTSHSHPCAHMRGEGLTTFTTRLPHCPWLNTKDIF